MALKPPPVTFSPLLVVVLGEFELLEYVIVLSVNGFESVCLFLFSFNCDLRYLRVQSFYNHPFAAGNCNYQPIESGKCSLT